MPTRETVSDCRVGWSGKEFVLYAVAFFLSLLVFHLNKYVPFNPRFLSPHSSDSFSYPYSVRGINLSPRDCGWILERDANVLLSLFKSNETTNILLDRRSKVMVEGWIQKNPGEQQVNAVFEELLFPQCSSNVLFLDIGANIGYYGIKSAKFGCRALLFDPQPGCIEIIEANLCLNFRSDYVISSVPFGLAQEAKEIMVPSSGCSSIYSLVHDAYKKPKEDLPSKLLDFSILKEMPKISLMIKIDTEGNEVDILAGILPLVRKHQVRDIMVEVTPKFWDSMGLARHSAVEVLAEYLEYCTIYEPKHYKTSFFVSLTESALEKLLTDPNLIQTDLWISCSRVNQ